jgi:hypothetical protein
MKADDDGVVEAYTVMQILNSSEDDLKALVGRGFVTVLNEDLVSVILDWTEHNLIRPDRKIDSIYKDLLLKVVPNIQTIEAKPRADTRRKTGQQVMDVQWTAGGPHRLGKDRLGKVNKISKDIENESPKEYGNERINKLLKGINERLPIKLPEDKKSRFVVSNMVKLLSKSDKRPWLSDKLGDNAAKWFNDYLDREVEKGYYPQSWNTLYAKLKLWIANEGDLSKLNNRFNGKS